MLWAAVACWAALVATPPWRDPRIHNLGNHGTKGALHAACAPLVTRIIDEVAYKGYDVRTLLRTDDDADTVDLGCGVGTSTSPFGVGVDASREMLAVARCRLPNATFERGLAERWGRTSAFSRATCAFLLHEQPRDRRRRILRNALRIASREVLVMDIHPTYTPSYMMKTGEPFVDDYLAHICDDVSDAGRAAGARVTTTSHCDERVVVFAMRKSAKESVTRRPRRRNSASSPSAGAATRVGTTTLAQAPRPP